MPYDTLVAESRRNDSPDGVRSVALDRVRRQRFQAMCVTSRAEIDGRLASRGRAEFGDGDFVPAAPRITDETVFRQITRGA